MKLFYRLISILSHSEKILWNISHFWVCRLTTVKLNRCVDVLELRLSARFSLLGRKGISAQCAGIERSTITHLAGAMLPIHPPRSTTAQHCTFCTRKSPDGESREVMVVWEPWGQMRSWGCCSGRRVPVKICGGEQAVFMMVRNIGLWKDLEAYDHREEFERERWGCCCKGAVGAQDTQYRKAGFRFEVKHLGPFSFALSVGWVIHRGVLLLAFISATIHKDIPEQNWPLSECVFADSNSKKLYVEDFIVLVRGGASEHVTALAYKDLPTAALMQEWGDAVQYNPEIIKLKVLHPSLRPASLSWAPQRALYSNKKDLKKKKGWKFLGQS